MKHTAYAGLMEKTVSKLASFGVIPVLVLEDIDSALKVCELLMKNNLPVADITFRTPAAASILRQIAKEFPDLYLGGGPVLSPGQLDVAFEAGAQFLDSSGINPVVVRQAVSDLIPFIPGVCTPSELETAVDCGVPVLKFFPAEPSGGVRMLQAMVGPYTLWDMQFIPSGGITRENAPDYLALPQVRAVFGTWVAPAADIQAGNWDVIAENIRIATDIGKKNS